MSVSLPLRADSEFGRHFNQLCLAGCSSRALADSWFALWPVPFSIKLRPNLQRAVDDSALLLANASMHLQRNGELVAATSARRALISLRVDLLGTDPLHLRVRSYLRLRLDGPFGHIAHNAVDWREDLHRDRQ